MKNFSFYKTNEIKHLKLIGIMSIIFVNSSKELGGKMKKNWFRRWKISLLVSWLFVITLTFMPLISQAMSKAELVPYVAKELGVSERVANAFIDYVRDFVFDIQNNFTKIASHETPQYTKNSLVTQTIEDYFKHPVESQVQVSSLNTKRINSYAVQTYLRRLSRLALERYDTVKLYFHKS